MRPPLDMDTVLRLGCHDRTPEQHRNTAAQLIAWAAEPHPADAPDVTPATLLAETGQLLEIAGDHAEALDAYRRAAASDGVVEPDVRGFLHRAPCRWATYQRPRLSLTRSAAPPPRISVSTR